MKTTQERLNDAREALTRAEAEYARHEASAKSHTFGGSDDPGVLSGIRRKPNAKADRARWNAYSRAAASVREVFDLRKQVELLESRLEREGHDATTKALVTPERLKGARLVRDRHGWHTLVRVNAKSVSVATGYSWVDRIALDDILEVRP